jgi:hypothetical protein
MFTTREQTIIARAAASAVALGVPVHVVFGDVIVTRNP